MSRRVRCIEEMFSVKKDGHELIAEIMDYKTTPHEKRKKEVEYGCGYRKYPGDFFKRRYAAGSLKELEGKMRETLEDCQYFLEHLEEFKKEFEKNAPEFLGYEKIKEDESNEFQ